MLGYLEFGSGRTMPLTGEGIVKLGREHTAAKSLHVSKSGAQIFRLNLATISSWP